MMVPDPLAFTMEGIVRHGGLVDLGGDGAGQGGSGRATPGGAGQGGTPQAPLALLPEALRRDLGLPEEVRLTIAAGAAAEAGLVSCGLGSPLLSRLVADARERPQVAAVKLMLDPPKPALAAGLGERAVVRNGLCEVIDV